MKKRLWIIFAICLGSVANAHIKSETSSGGFVGDLQADSTDIKQTSSIQK